MAREWSVIQVVDRRLGAHGRDGRGGAAVGRDNEAPIETYGGGAVAAVDENVVDRLLGERQRNDEGERQQARRERPDAERRIDLEAAVEQKVDVCDA